MAEVLQARSFTERLKHSYGLGDLNESWTRVAVCTAPSRIMVDGTAKEIADGKTLSLPSGVNILHRGNVYVVVDQAGNSVRAEDNTSYLNVTVGLGRWPQQAKGILASAGQYQ